MACNTVKREMFARHKFSQTNCNLRQINVCKNFCLQKFVYLTRVMAWLFEQLICEKFVLTEISKIHKNLCLRKFPAMRYMHVNIIIPASQSLTFLCQRAGQCWGVIAVCLGKPATNKRGTCTCRKSRQQVR